MENSYEKNQNLWRLIGKLKVKWEAPSLGKLYLDVLELECLKKMQIYGMDQQIWLRHQINILDCEMASAERLIEEYKLFCLPIPQAI
ncbi:hypothetical protein [Pedobacter sp.]|uniref:hypothetical protein n=1 Tax=Pedobacter sp. TaxID=1411316 RepID=UPI003BA8AE87